MMFRQIITGYYGDELYWSAGVDAERHAMVHITAMGHNGKLFYDFHFNVKDDHDFNERLNQTIKRAMEYCYGQEES